MKAIVKKCIYLAALMALSAPPASAAVLASNATYGVADGSQLLRPLVVGIHGIVLDVNLDLTFAKCSNPALPPNAVQCSGRGNAFNDEIVFRLTNAHGTVVDLVSAGTYYAGTVGSGRTTLSFDDEAAIAAGGPVLVSGSFRPVSPLSAFDGGYMFGSWSLLVRDSEFGDPLSFYGASLDIDYRLPEPGTLALCCLALFALRKHAHGRSAS